MSPPLAALPALCAWVAGNDHRIDLYFRISHGSVLDMAQLMKKMNRCKILLITLLVAGSLLGPDTSLSRAVPEREAVDAGWQIKDSGLSQPRRSLNLTKAEQDFLREHPVIRVGNEDDWPPFDFSENGKPRGYAIEHLELLGRKLGISFTYVNGHTWSELLELFQKKQIDVLPSLWISEARKKYMLFTEPFLELPYVIVTPDNHTSVKSFFDLQDMVIPSLMTSSRKRYSKRIILKSSFTL